MNRYPTLKYHKNNNINYFKQSEIFQAKSLRLCTFMQINLNSHSLKPSDESEPMSANKTAQCNQ